MLVGLLWAGVAGATTRAEQLLFAGNLAEALPVAREEAIADPDDLDAQERYIDALLSIGLLGLADQTYRARVEGEADADSWYLFGRVLVDPAEAERAYRRALGADPSHARAEMGLAAVYRATGRLAQAEASYAVAVERDRRLGEAWTGLIATQAALGRRDEAVATARRAIAALPSDADAYLALAALRPEEAVDVLTRAAVAAPSDPRVHASLAEAHLDRGNGAGAVVAAEHALTVSPGMADPALSLVFAEEMIVGNLDAQGYHELLAVRLVEPGDPFAALHTYDALVARYPRSPLPLMGRARVLAGQRDHDRAVADLGRAIGLDPRNQEAQAALGLVLVQAERAEEAVPILERVVARRAGDATLALALASAQESVGDRAGALETVEAARALRPLHVVAALTHARLLSEAGQPVRAYQELLKLAGDVPDERVVLALAAASRDIGRTAEAADLLDVLARSTGNPAFAELAGRLRR